MFPFEDAPRHRQKSLVLSYSQVASCFSREGSKLKKTILAQHMKEAEAAGGWGW
jgi:hypothetical protein